MGMFYPHFSFVCDSPRNPPKRNEVFRRELPLALTAIRYRDRILFNTYPQLEQASIIVNFMSAYPQFARQENWGTFNSNSLISLK
jgi:hypothetical protein